MSRELLPLDESTAAGAPASDRGDIAAAFRPAALEAPPTLMVVAAFLALYIIWGSTYLAIRFAIETTPPFLMAGIRFLIAGVLLYGWARWRGAARPTAVQWRSTALIGALLLVGGNGGVVWAEQHVSSGATALLVATVPLWMALIDWLRPGGRRPVWRAFAGVLIGLAGIVMLVEPWKGAGGTQLAGAIVLVLASLSWSIGSIYSRHTTLPASPIMATAMEMLCGGGLLLLFGGVMGDWGRFDPTAVSGKSLAALAYLLVFGSLIGFSAYVWLLQVSTPSRVATYAYVNPVIAVFLGWLLGNESVTKVTLLAAGVIVFAVVIITTSTAARKA